MKTNPRGNDLDQAIEEICIEFLETDPKIVKISRSLIQKRLGLKSRSTLVGSRGAVIDHYANLQLKNAGLTKSGKKKRDSTKTIEKLRLENDKLRKERDQAISDYSAIIYGLKIRGIDAEEIMQKIFDPNGR